MTSERRRFRARVAVDPGWPARHRHEAGLAAAAGRPRRLETSDRVGIDRLLARLLTLCSIAILICASALSTLAPAVPSGTTTTQVVLSIHQAAPFGSIAIDGTLIATFEAAPYPGGWAIKASFRPEDLVLSGGIQGSASGNAKGRRTLAVGATGSIFATRLSVSGGNPSLYVDRLVLVDANGVVWVQECHLGLLDPDGSGGPCICA